MKELHPTIEAALPTKKQTAESMMGCLKKYANPALVPQERQAWSINVKEKYGTV
jgi:hypothetical protein